VSTDSADASADGQVTLSRCRQTAVPRYRQTAVQYFFLVCVLCVYQMSCEVLLVFFSLGSSFRNQLVFLAEGVFWTTSEHLKRFIHTTQSIAQEHRCGNLSVIVAEMTQHF